MTDLGTQYIRSRLIAVPHGMFTCHGGASPPPYASLNLSYGVGDDPGHVAANRQRVKEALGLQYLLSARQVHGIGVYCAKDINNDREADGFDALITNQPGLGLLIQQADCQAVLLHDPARQVIAAVHCGWRGSAANIIGRTIERMRQEYQTKPQNLMAAISPSLGPCCAEFVNYQQELPQELHAFQDAPRYFNFRKISESQLTAAGVQPHNIDPAEICTVCDPNYFSYRRAKKSNSTGITGRNGSVISLPSQSIHNKDVSKKCRLG